MWQNILKNKICGFCVFEDNVEYREYINKCLDSMIKTQTDYEFDFYVYTNTPNYIENYPFKVREIKSIINVSIYRNITNLISNKLLALDELSKEYEIVFFIDLDLYFRKSLKEVFNNLQKGYLYASLELDNIKNFSDKRKRLLKKYNIRPLQYINAGFMILTFEYNFDLVDYKNFLNNQIECPEQDYINYKLKDKIKVVKVSHNPLLTYNSDPYIFHFLGFYKPSNNLIDYKYLKEYKRI